MALRVYVESLGCKLNQCERDALACQFSAAGYVVVPHPGDANVCVVNTCAVTHVADRKSRQRLRSLRRVNPGAWLVATGCYAELADLTCNKPEPNAPGDSVYPGGHLRGALDADLVVPNARKQDIVSLVQAQASVRWSCEEATALLNGASLPGEGMGLSSRAICPRTRPLVQIQDGCDNACAYCIVHVLRGPHRSRPRQEIVS